jgi:carbamoyl-phosphate synthase large subunit
MKINILITATGSAIAQGIMKSIKLSGIDCNIIAADTQPYAAGLYRGKKAYIIPLAKDPGFIDKIIKICKDEDIHCIFIGTDYELLKFAENKTRIEKETNAKVMVSTSEAINIADDKWLTHKFLVKNNMPHIPSVLPEDMDQLINECGFPLIVKPRIGDSSKDTFVVKNKQELLEKLEYMNKASTSNKFLASRTSPIIQKYLPNDDEEFTSTTLTFDNKCYGVLSMNREMRFGGHTTKAIIRNFPTVDRHIKEIAEKFNAFGPANFQSRLIDGVPHVFEINCRFSGTTPFCAEVGFNTVEAALRKVIFKEEIQGLKFKEGVILRYFNEMFIPLEEIEKLKLDGFIENPVSEINKVL